MSNHSDSAVIDLRCEYQINPLGLGQRGPRLSWRLASTRRNATQSACQIRVAPSIEWLRSGTNLLWDTQRLNTGDSIHHVYAGPSLRSGQCCYWQVRIWDETGAVTAWSEPAWWEMGLLEATDWEAHWIAPIWEEDPTHPQPSPLLRTDFKLDAPPRHARLYVTALGLYVCEINGRRVGAALLTPGWTSYHHRLLVQTYDVTDRLRPGANAIGAFLGEGWYRGRIGAVGGRRCAYGETPCLLLQLIVDHPDGTKTIVASDRSWQAATGPILASGIYDGERYDARLERTGWSLPGGADAAWQPVRVLDRPFDNLEPSSGPSVRAIQELSPVAVDVRHPTRTIYDMGQNIAG